jgi:hypothetical protein
MSSRLGTTYRHLALSPPLPVKRMASSAEVAAASMAMPPMIYGCAWKKERTASLVAAAVAAGFRGIDTACQPKHYEESGVGEALASILTSGAVAREELWLQTKYTPIGGQDPATVPYNPSSPVPEQVSESLACSLRNLGVDYIDSVLLHSPLPTHEETMGAWRVLEAAVQVLPPPCVLGQASRCRSDRVGWNAGMFVQAGTIRQLGISNLKSLAQLQVRRRWV